MLWGRRAGKRKLPGLVRAGLVIGDVEEVEEWNEYGELKDNIGGGDATETAGTPGKSYALPSTPSKSTTTAASTPKTTSTESPAAPAQTEPQPRSTQATTTGENPMTMAMRQAGFEAAKKAGDAKSKARTEALDAAKAKGGSLEKLDNAGPTGVPPPTGTTQAEDAITGVGSDSKEEGMGTLDPKAEKEASGSTATSETATNSAPTEEAGSEVLEGTGQAETSTQEQVPTASAAESAANEAILQDKSHVVLKGHGQTPVTSAPPSEKADNDDNDEEEDEDNGSEKGGGNVKGYAGSTLKMSTSASDEAEALPGTRKQEQTAGKGEDVGDSVAD